MSLAAAGAVVSLLIVCSLLFKNGKLAMTRVVIPLMLAMILLPSIAMPGSMPAIRLEFVLVLMVYMILTLGSLASNRALRMRWTPIDKWFLLFGISIMVSMISSTLTTGSIPIARDYWEFVKLLEYFLIFFLITSLRVTSENIRRYYWSVLFIFVLAALFGFAQYLDLGNINSTITPYYAPTQIGGLISHGRITGTTANPNEFGALMVLASSLALAGALFCQSRKKVLLTWICFAIFLTAIILTRSRSVLIILAGAVSYILFIRWPLEVGIRKIAARMFVILLAAVVIIGIAVSLAPNEMFSRVRQLADISTMSSWQARLIMWRDNLELWKMAPILGWGPSKATMATTIDNEWLLLLRRYGLVGCTIFICWLGNFYIGLARIRKVVVLPEMKALTIALQATLLAYGVYMILAAVYHASQLMPILLVLLGLAYSQSLSDNGQQTEKKTA